MQLWHSSSLNHKLHGLKNSAAQIRSFVTIWLVDASGPRSKRRNLGLGPAKCWWCFSKKNRQPAPCATAKRVFYVASSRQRPGWAVDQRWKGVQWPRATCRPAELRLRLRCSFLETKTTVRCRPLLTAYHLRSDWCLKRTNASKLGISSFKFLLWKII